MMLLVLACADAPVAAPAEKVEEDSGDPTGWTSTWTDGGGTSTTPTQGTDPTTDSDPGTSATGGTTTPAPEDCFEVLAPDGDDPAPDYAQFAPLLNSTCTGTDHQDIADVQHVVFLGDSITVGSPPTLIENMYRNVLATELASRFSIEAPDYWWQWYDSFEGTGYLQDSGAFSVCAKWGARTDDLVEDNDQVVDCIPEGSEERTLVVMTVGGNDLFSLVEDYYAGVAVDELWATVEREMGLLREAVEWMKTDKERFPDEVDVVFANVYEFTDDMGNVDACPGADSLGYSYDLDDPELQEMIVWMNEEAMSIAVDTRSDMMFLHESFCGHGYNADDPSGPCYRGPDAELWFDLTCFHPNDSGHLAIADLFRQVIEE